jgi:SPP1 gp7 family putative phage head morphogenesis protein
VKGVSKAFDKVLRDVWAKKGKATYSFAYFDATATIMRDALYRGWKGDDKLQLSIPNNPKLDIDYTSDDWRVISNMEANLFRFSSAKTLDVVNKLNAQLPNSRTFEEFKKNTAGIAEAANENHLRTEYNYAWQVAQNAAEYQRMAEEKDLYPFWEYRTAGDSRVRPAHRLLDKKVFKADDPFFQSVWPPLDWGCRCYVKPLRSNNTPELWDKKKAIDALDSTVIDDKGTTEWERMKQNGMNVNRAKIGQVFDLNKEYANSLGAKLGIKDNGVEAFKDMKDLPALDAPKRTAAEAKTWYEDNVKDNIITDYAGRPIEFTEDTVTSHTRKTKYAEQNRAGLLELLPDILNGPDEVWLSQRAKGRYQYQYMKMYEEGPMAVIVELDENMRSTVSTWYLIDKQPDDMRSGILIKKKR